MRDYRLKEIDLSSRIQLAQKMQDPSRQWGEVTELSRRYQVSRKFLYQLKWKATEALQEALAPKKPGPKEKRKELDVDQTVLKRSILTLATAIPGSIRGIQVSLKEIFGVHCSLGFISETLQQAAAKAREMLDQMVPSAAVLGELDEIFHNHRPCLTVLDGRSLMLLYLSAHDRRDSTNWGVSLLDLDDRGIKFHDMVFDGAKGIKKGIEEAQLEVMVSRDLFHLLRDGLEVERSLEREAYSRIREVQQLEKEGDEKKVLVALRKEQEAIERYDLFLWLRREIRSALEPWKGDYSLNSAQEAGDVLEAAAELMEEMGDGQIRWYAGRLRRYQEELLRPLRRLHEELSPYREGLDEEWERLIIWAYVHREELGIKAGEGFPKHLEEVVEGYWRVLDGFHRSTSLVESLNSWIRPHIVVHRGMPGWLGPLLQLYWNHHIFPRGKRRGRSPVQIAGCNEVLRWSEVLDRLVGEGEAKAA